MTQAGFELRGWGICNIQQDIAFDESYILRMLDEAALADINYIELIGPYYNQPERCPIDSLITYRNFPKLNASKSMHRDLETIHSEIAKFNRVCTRASQYGLEITVWTHELWFPMDILDFYPIMGDGHGKVIYRSETFQEFFLDKYAELFENVPNLSGVVLTVVESTTLNIFNLSSSQDRHMRSDQAFLHLVNGIAGVCEKYGRQLYLRNFGYSNRISQGDFLLVMQDLDPKVRLHQKTCDHGDWHNPFQKSNPHLGITNDRFELVEEDLGQEYFGLGRFPVVYPEVLKSRIQNAHKKGVRGVVARVDRGAYGSPKDSFHNRIIDHEGILNLLAFNALASNPQMELSSLIWAWAEKYYGPPYPFALKSLESGASIFHDLYYIYPGEDSLRHFRGSWLAPDTIMDDRFGPFAAFRESGGYRTQKELALIRCERVLGELNLGKKDLGKASKSQKENYLRLIKKFEDLHLFGRRRLAVLDIFAAFEDYFFHAGGYLKKQRLFLEMVENFYDQFGRDAQDIFIDRHLSQPYSNVIQTMFDLLRVTGKMDIETYNGYCAAGEV